MLELRMVQREALLQSLRGITQAAFPEVEKQLKKEGFTEALKYVVGRKNMSKYRSVTDFLFCEMNPEWQPECKRFYANRGRPLRDILSQQHLRAYNARLLMALDVAHTLCKDQRRRGWNWFVKQVSIALMDE